MYEAYEENYTGNTGFGRLEKELREARIEVTDIAEIKEAFRAKRAFKRGYLLVWLPLKGCYVDFAPSKDGGDTIDFEWPVVYKEASEMRLLLFLRKAQT